MATKTPTAFTPQNFKLWADPVQQDDYRNPTIGGNQPLVAPPAPAPAPVQQPPADSGKMSLSDFAKSIKEKYPQYAQVPDEELARKTIEKYPVYADKVHDPVREEAAQQKAADTEGEGDGFFKSLARPFVKAGVTGAAALEGIAKWAMGGDIANDEALNRHLTEGYNVPGFGKVSPNKIGEDIKFQKDEQGNEKASGGYFGTETAKTIGTAAEIAPWLMGAGEVTAAPKAFATKGFLKGLGREAAVGAFGGATGGAGSQLSKAQHDETAGDVAKRTAFGTVVGGALGGALGVAVPSVIGAAKGLAGAGRKGVTAIQGAAERSAAQAADISAIKGASMEQAAMLRKLAETQSSAEARAAAEQLATSIEKKGAAEAAAVSQANKSGLDQTVVDFIRSATPDDKLANQEMLSIAKRAAKDLRSTEQPKQVPGRTIIGGAKHLITTKNQGVQETNRILNSLDNTPQDMSAVLNDFLTDMRNKGIHVVKRGNGAQMVTTGAVPEEDLPFYKAIFNRLMPDKNGKVLRNYKELHDLRQYIFEKLDLAKARQQPFSNDVAQYGEQLRSKLMQPISKASNGAYQKSQQKIAQSLSSLQEFVRLMGFKGNLSNLSTKDLRAGEVAGRILGNAADRPMSVLEQMMNTAKQYGYAPRGNYADQIRFADILENLFGTTQTRSLRGQVGRAGMDVVSEAAGAVQDAAKLNIAGLGSRALKAIIGKSKEDQIKALEDLVMGSARTNFGKK